MECQANTRLKQPKPQPFHCIPTRKGRTKAYLRKNFGAMEHARDGLLYGGCPFDRNSLIHRFDSHWQEEGLINGIPAHARNDEVSYTVGDRNTDSFIAWAQSEHNRLIKATRIIASFKIQSYSRLRPECVIVEPVHPKAKNT